MMSKTTPRDLRATKSNWLGFLGWATVGVMSCSLALVAIGSQDTQGERAPVEEDGGEHGDHWPGFRGAHSIPVSSNERLPRQWSTTENVEWVSEVPGVGWSSPVVWGNRVFLTSATSDQAMKQPSLGTDFSNDYIAEMRAEGLPSEEINRRLFARDRELPDEIVIRLMLFCFDLDSGQRLWEREMYHGRPKGGRHRKNSFASETPVTDGKMVYVYLTHHGLFAFGFDGEPVWKTPLTAHPTVRDFGTGASPALLDDRIFVLNDNEEQGFIAAFDKATGKQLWRQERAIEARRKTSWSTPYVWRHELRNELVTSGPGVVISYGLDGEELWRMHRMAGTAIQTPFAWDGLLYVTSGSSAGDNRPLVAIRPGARGDITLDEKQKSSDYIAWSDRLAGGTYLPTPLIYRGGLYVLTEKGIFSKHDPKTGVRLFRARVAPGAGAFTASPWAYNGLVFVLGEEGDTYVIEAGDEYRLAGVNRLDEWTLASPAIVGDRLLIRTQSRLYSIRN